MKKKIIAAGHICLDITPVFPDRKVENPAEIFLPGKLIQMREADVHTGGSVANTGLAMKFLGADVSLMGMVGADAFGDMIRNILKKYDAHEGMLVSQTATTSYSVVLAVPGVDRIFLHHPGANQEFREADVPGEALRDASLFHFGYPPLMKAMYEEEGAELTALFRRVKESGVATSLDLAAVDASSEAGALDWEAILRRVLPYVDFFVPSIEELCFMLDRPRFAEWQKRANGGDITEILCVETDIKPLAQKCLNYGAKVVLLKCGAPGMYLKTADEKALEMIGARAGLDGKIWAGQEIFEISYVPDKILSGTGAGDTSIAAFLTAMLQGYSPQDTLRFATATGASCVEAYDALSGLRTFDEIQEKIAAGWQKKERNS